MVRYLIGCNRRKLVAVCLALLLTACARGSATIYDLVITPAENPAYRTTNSQLLIAFPHAIRVLSTDNIAVFSSDIEISYFSRAKWSDELPTLIQTKLVEVFENSGRNIAVGVPGDGMLADYRLVTEIRAFHFAVNHGRLARVAIAAKIVNERNGRIEGSQLFQSEISVQSTDTGKVVSGLNSVANEVLKEIVNWTLQNVD